MSSKVIVVTAPSGAGKSSICRRLLEAFADISFSVSATTRPPRDYEQDGREYRFLSNEQFLEAVAADRFLEYEEVYPGIYYGTLKEDVETALEKGHVLLDIDVNGAVRVKEAYGGRALTVFVKPPSVDELRQRLVDRKTETSATVATRMRRAEHELGFENRFDVSVLNDDLDRAAEETIKIVSSFINVPVRE